MANQRKPEIIECRNIPCALCGGMDNKVIATGKDYQYGTTDQTFFFVACLNCGHEYLNPQPVPEDLPKAYPADYYTLEGRHTARKSKIIPHLKSFVIKRRLRDFEELFIHNASVLEVGCGDGSLLIDLKKRYPHLRLTGMDFSVSLETKQQFASLGIYLMICRVEDAVLEPDSFDLIIMNQLIEHVADPPSVLASLSRSLKPGGMLSIETPNRLGYDRRLFYRSFWGGYYFPRHLHLFDKNGMTVLLSRYKLSVERHAYLLAPIIWAFSVQGLLQNYGKRHFWKICTGFFTDRNPLCLAIFTMTDLFARLIGLPTSNQKFIARK